MTRDSDPAELQPLLDCYAADEMVAEPVTAHVNNVRNNVEKCVEGQ
jgi:putative SOS response-associated peptidase YedK